MRDKNCGIKIFSASTLKVLACVFMLCDHIGFMLLPDVHSLRVVGRLAYPIFAYFIAEGCRYTKNRKKHFFSVFLLGVVCETVYLIFLREYYGNILLTFSVSILLIYLLDRVKKAFDKSVKQFVLLLCAFIVSVVAVAFYCAFVGLDYGFLGVIAPVVAYLPFMYDESERLFEIVDKRTASVFLFSVVLFFTVFSKDSLDYQVCCLLAVPLLLMYNGSRGRYNLKHAFYLFYPLHLLMLQGLVYLV